MDDEQVTTGTEESAGQQTQEEVAPAPQGPAVYTSEELAALTPTDIDIERVDPAYRPIVENTIRDYKALQADHTRKSQELAELKKAPPEPETYFPDGNTDKLFRDYLASPFNVVSNINAEITRLEGITPYDEDGNPNTQAYRQARTLIAQWQGIKDTFSMKRQEVEERKRTEESTLSSLGEEAAAVVDYGKTLGFSEKDLKSRPNLLKTVKTLYAKENATKTAVKKEVKPTPQRAATPSGESSVPGIPEVDTSKMSDQEWYAYQQKQRRQSLQRRLGG